METQNNNKGVIALLIVIIIILATLCVLFATGTISFNSNKANNNDTNENVNKNNNIETNDDKINIDISMNNVSVLKDAPNAKISVVGTINLSYDNTKYTGVTLSGYCLGNENEKYLIHGPGDGRVLFHNDNNVELTLTEDIPQNVEYTDGTIKAWSEIDWENVKIKYCKIEKMTAILNDGTNHPETVLNVEKSFE